MRAAEALASPAHWRRHLAGCCIATAVLQFASGSVAAAELGGRSPADRDDAFAQAAAVAPTSALIARRQCEALAAVGNQSAALEACHQALRVGANSEVMRATVGALLRGGRKPTPEQLAEASMLLDALLHVSRSQVPTLAAECDLFEALGDWGGYRQCVSELQRLAPGDPETRRATAIFAQRRPGWHVTAGWLLMGILGLLTLGHALANSVSRAWRRIALRASSVLLILAIWPTSAWAESSPETSAAPEGMSDWSIDDKNPEASVPTEQQKNRDPLQFGYFIMDLTERAEAYEKRGDNAGAVRYYRALAKAVPDRAVAFSRMCKAYQALGDIVRAKASCKFAVSLEGAKVEDYQRLSELILAEKGELASEAIADIDEIVRHLRTQLPDGPQASQVECRLGLRLRDQVRLQNCTAQLANKAPSDPETITFRWAYALLRSDYRAALTFIAFAKASSLPADSIRKMQEATEQAMPWWRKRHHYLWMLGAAAALAVGLVISWRWALQRRIPTFINSQTKAA